MFTLKLDFLDELKKQLRDFNGREPAMNGPQIHFACTTCQGSCRNTCSGSCRGSCSGGCVLMLNDA